MSGLAALPTKHHKEKQMTLEQLIAQCKKENPTMTATINGEAHELTAEEYEEAATNWAKMRLEQIEAESK